MNIAIDGRASTLYRGTGIGNYTYQLLNNLNKIDTTHQYNVYISENSKLDLNLKNNFSLKFSEEFTKNNFWEDIKSPNLIDVNSDLYHIPQNGIGITNNSSIPQIITLHDIIPLKMPETVSDNYLSIFDKELPKILNSISGIITVSNYSKDDIHKTLGFPKEKIFVTHLAAESQYKPLDKNTCKSFLKENYNLNDDYILYVGGFSPRKNILGLIDAFCTSYPSLSPLTKLVVIGRKGVSYEIYKNRAIALGIEDKVIFTGFIPTNHMPIFYNSALMLVYPSFYEGFGLPPIEAMACGTPVISSNLTSIPEVVDNSTMLINPSDVSDISNSIIKLATDLDFKNNLIQKGLNQSAKFSWHKTARETINAYENTIKLQ
ncbi:glycosyltransferase family 1 protein [uncultured Clostridium sp.]|jgi:glycosyltransferase involved in cell wall biosynthesis|uniref:glycosyltransferase family 4 protein n=1 Tax=uncultured Clostridium sp. TaxID=59620 RepID=UPI00262EB295|nr:glycosyltransferase family 1 protein [uncultured Clostridium sp.]